MPFKKEERGQQRAAKKLTSLSFFFAKSTDRDRENRDLSCQARHLASKDDTSCNNNLGSAVSECISIIRVMLMIMTTLLDLATQPP